MATSSAPEPKPFNSGQIVDGKWRIKQLLGKGACGVVYKVESKTRRGFYAAMKIEFNSPDYDQTLRLEIGVLNKLKNKKHMMQILDYGKRRSFTYMVTNLCGKDLMALRCKIKRGFNDSTALRIAVFTLYGLKQIHDAGYIHRDVKPGNVITAANKGRDSRTLLLIDFGMARSFVTTDPNGKKQLRPMRRRIPLRGTIRYCSLNVHERLEQGRSDDLIAMIYMIIEVTLGVPWHSLKDEKQIWDMKKNAKDTELFEDLPDEFKMIFEYLKPLTYPDKPDYLMIYNLLIGAITRLKINFLDPYEWEDEEIEKDLKQEAENERLKNEKEKKEQQEQQAKCKTAPAEVEKPAAAAAAVSQQAQSESKVETDRSTGQETIHVNNQDQVQEKTGDAISLHISGEKTISSNEPDDVNNNGKNKAKTGVKKPIDEKMDTAIEALPEESKTKKAVAREVLQFHVYPAVAMDNFTESAFPF